MIRRWVYDKEGHAHEVSTQSAASEVHFVQPDFNEHGGRAKFREYLKRTGSSEIGHSDMNSMKAKWDQRKAEHAEKMRKISSNRHVKEAAAPPVEDRPYQRSELSKALANRLDGRPEPDRKTFIKLAIETSKQLARRGY